MNLKEVERRIGESHLEFCLEFGKRLQTVLMVAESYGLSNDPSIESILMDYLPHRLGDYYEGKVELTVREVKICETILEMYVSKGVKDLLKI